MQSISNKLNNKEKIYELDLFISQAYILMKTISDEVKMNIQKSTSTFLVDAGLMNLMPICLLMPISMIFELELQSYFTMYQKRKSRAIGTPEEQDPDI